MSRHWHADPSFEEDGRIRQLEGMQRDIHHMMSDPFRREPRQASASYYDETGNIVHGIDRHLNAFDHDSPSPKRFGSMTRSFEDPGQRRMWEQDFKASPQPQFYTLGRPQNRFNRNTPSEPRSNTVDSGYYTTRPHNRIQPQDHVRPEPLGNSFKDSIPDEGYIPDRSCYVKGEDGSPRYKVEFEIGHAFTPNNVSVVANGNTLTVKCRKNEKDGFSTISKEFSRTVDVPDNVNPKEVRAFFQNGVLILDAPTVPPRFDQVQISPEKFQRQGFQSSSSKTHSVPVSSNSTKQDFEKNILSRSPPVGSSPKPIYREEVPLTSTPQVRIEKIQKSSLSSLNKGEFLPSMHRHPTDEEIADDDREMLRNRPPGSIKQLASQFEHGNYDRFRQQENVPFVHHVQGHQQRVGHNDPSPQIHQQRFIQTSQQSGYPSQQRNLQTQKEFSPMSGQFVESGNPNVTGSFKRAERQYQRTASPPLRHDSFREVSPPVGQKFVLEVPIGRDVEPGGVRVNTINRTVQITAEWQEEGAVGQPLVHKRMNKEIVLPEGVDPRGLKAHVIEGGKLLLEAPFMS